MAESAPEFGKLVELAIQALEPSKGPISKDTASRALVIGIEGLIAANLSNAGTVNGPI
jgi:hypothetical protein